MLIWVTKLSHNHDKTVTYDKLSITPIITKNNDKFVAKKKGHRKGYPNISSPTDNYYFIQYQIVAQYRHSHLRACACMELLGHNYVSIYYYTLV